MSVIILTFIASAEEIAPGMPSLVTIESNIPSTIYYTIDGSTPTINSEIYIDPVQMPVYLSPMILQAFGVDSNNVAGTVLTQTFTNISIVPGGPKKPEINGVVIDRDWIGPYYLDGYSAGSEVGGFAPVNSPEFVSVDPDLLTIEEVTGPKGFDGIEPGTKIEVGIPALTDIYEGREGADLDTQLISFVTTEKAAFFNPYARYIVNDTRKNNEIQLIMRPWGSFSDVYQEQGGQRIRQVGDDGCYISGGYVKTFYSARSNTMVSYYFDHNEARWIKNIQPLPKGIKLPHATNSHGPPLVFPWIPRGRALGIGW